MNAMPLVVWLIGWSLACDLSAYLRSLRKPAQTEKDRIGAGGTNFVVWVIVALLLLPGAMK